MVSSEDANVEPEEKVVSIALGAYSDVPDEILISYVIPKLSISDRIVLSCVDRRSRALVEQDTLQEKDVRDGHLKLCDFFNSTARLRWAREQGCPWDWSTCRYAAKGGHLEVLKWAREHDCPWDDWTCLHAAFSAPLEVLQWAMEHGAPVPPMGHYAQWYEHLLRGEPHALDRHRTFEV